MSAAPWKIGLVIVLGSAAGALIRQALILVLSRSRAATSGMLAGSSILGGLFGAAKGGIMTTSAFTAEEQGLWLVGLIAALGTFGASAVLGAAQAPQQATSLLRTAAVHIALAIVAAAFGIGLIHWARSASG
jgi:hypothetical protein